MYTKEKEALMYGRNSYGLGKKIGLLDKSKYDAIFYITPYSFKGISHTSSQGNAES